MSASSQTPKAFLIDGEWIRASTDVIDSVNPASGGRNFEVLAADASHVDLAVAAAERASSSWRELLPHQRAAVLYRIGELLTANEKQLARLQMIENGKIWSECIAQARSAAATFRYFAGVCEAATSEMTPSRGNYVSLVVNEPYGVVAAITPWNSPMTNQAQKVAPALAGGNAVILKPSEGTPSVALELGRLAMEAGLPRGLLNVLPGTGASTGAAVVKHPGVRMISFTGGNSNGKAIATTAANRLVPVALELGGKSPHIVFDDANLEAAASGVAGGIFKGSGQSCVAGSRLFVQRSVYDEVVKRVVERARSIRVDLPDAPDAKMGPIASFAHRARIEALVDDARGEGADLLVGGRRPEDQRLSEGAFYLPTVVAGIDNTARIAQQEVFGPVLCVLPFDDEEDLVAQANDSAYGLAAGIWTSDYRRAWRVARKLEAGTVWINTYQEMSVATPFGGFKQSGIGRERGIEGVRLYQQAKAVFLSLN